MMRRTGFGRFDFFPEPPPTRILAADDMFDVDVMVCRQEPVVVLSHGVHGSRDEARMNVE
jgi:hypothetical protein